MTRSGGRFLNDHGQIDDGFYCVGWARRGPTGTIGTNRPDGYEVADRLPRRWHRARTAARRAGRGLDALLTARGVEPTSFDDWRRIEAAEAAAARAGSPREKFVRHRRLAEGAGPLGWIACANPKPPARKPALLHPALAARSRSGSSSAW